MRAYRALLVGLGRIGCLYDYHLPFKFNQPHSSPSILSHARALACHPDFDLVAGVDPCAHARESFLNLYGSPAFSDLRSWRSSSCGTSSIDLVVIAVAPQIQPDLVAQILSMMTPRILLLEKPVASSFHEAYALEKLCTQQPGLFVAVNYIRRYLPAVLEWQERLKAGQLGELLHGQITYGKGLLSNGSHFVNLAEAWLGPLKMLRVINQGSSCMGFDRESTLDMQVLNHGLAPLHVRSVGECGLRAGELDLWFQGGRLCWCNDGRAISFWPRRPPVDGDSHAALAAEPELTFTNIENYQFEVVNSLAHTLRDPLSKFLHCSLSDGVRTLRTLSQCL